MQLVYKHYVIILIPFTFLLIISFSLQYSFFLLVFFLLEMFIAVAGFVFPHTVQSLLDETFTDKIITSYREDPDLQNLIDFGQKKVCIDTVMAKISITYFAV